MTSGIYANWLAHFANNNNNNINALCSWEKYSWADDMVQVAQNEMWASEVCFACLTWTVC